MYAETGLLFPSFQNFSSEIQHLDEFYRFNKPNVSSMNELVRTTISEYDLGGEGDLFKAPEPIIEEPIMELDPVTAAISMITSGEDAIASQGFKVADIESLQNEPLLSDIFYACRKDILENAAINAPLAEILDIKVPLMRIDENEAQESKLPLEVLFQKSVSSECLSSMEWMHGDAVNQNFLNFPALDFGVAYGMRRAFSDGDIKTLGSGNTSVQSPLQPQTITSSCTSEERQEKLSRYRSKKSKRNFGRKIKYACRKALADSQPRFRGRFARTEESDGTKRAVTFN